MQTHTRRLHALRVVNKHVDLFIMILFYPRYPCVCACVLAAGRSDNRDGMREKVKLTPNEKTCHFGCSAVMAKAKAIERVLVQIIRGKAVGGEGATVAVRK